MIAPDARLTRIAVFYDGSHFQKVSDYYRFGHARRARLSIAGIHEFAKTHVAKEEGVDPKFCQIVDAHYFRGRFSTHQAAEKGKLESDRILEDILIRENVIMHFLPMSPKQTGGWGEKGIDVWLALEAYELAVLKRFNVLVLIAGDGDFLPLVRKLNTLGTRVMLLAWDFAYKSEFGIPQETRTSQVLIDEATYPVMMHTVIDSRASKADPLIDNLFVESEPDIRPALSLPIPTAPVKPIIAPVVPAVPQSSPAVTAPPEPKPTPPGKPLTGKIYHLNRLKFCGGINADGKDYFFLGSHVREINFDDLKEGDAVVFNLIANWKKPGEMMATDVRRIIEMTQPVPPASTI